MRPVEQNFVDATRALLDYDPSRLGSLLLEALQPYGVRILGVVLGASPKPQVFTSIMPDDVSAEAVTAVVRKLMLRFNAPPQTVDMLAGTAGATAANYVRAFVAQWRNERRRPEADAAGPKRKWPNNVRFRRGAP